MCVLQYKDLKSIQYLVLFLIIGNTKHKNKPSVQ